MAAAAARAAPGGEEDGGVDDDDDGIVGDGGAEIEGSPPAPWLSSDDAETRIGRGNDSEGLVVIETERKRGLGAGAGAEEDDDDFAARVTLRRSRCVLAARCTRGSLAALEAP